MNCHGSSKTSSTPSWNAASWRTGSCGYAAARAVTASCWPSAASAGGFSARVARGSAHRAGCRTWLRRRRTWRIVCFPICPRIGGNLTAGNLSFVGVGLRCTADTHRAVVTVRHGSIQPVQVTQKRSVKLRTTCRGGPRSQYPERGQLESAPGCGTRQSPSQGRLEAIRASGRHRGDTCPAGSRQGRYRPAVVPQLGIGAYCI